jgi:vacuolar-type H+-ATPase subunit H
VKKPKFAIRAAIFSGCFLAVVPVLAQQLIVTLRLDGNQIGMVKTAQGLTTRLTFPESVKEVICGDLYDSASGKGTFVVQRSDNDVFIKPITTKGASNLFVRTGDKARRIYNFDLSIVTFDKAYRVVNVENDDPVAQPVAANAPQATAVDPAIDKGDPTTEARAQADEILRTARQQASRIVAEAQQSVDEMQRQAIADGPQQIQRRFISALLGGLNATRTSNTHAVTQKKVTLGLDKDMYTFEGRTYIRYTIQNSGSEDFVYSDLRLEAGATPASRKPVSAEVIQSKTENKVIPGETVAGILVFDQSSINPKDKLVLSVQGKDDNTLTHIVVLE